MLAKVLKYDLKNVFKGLIAFYSLSLFFGILTRILFNINGSLFIEILASICNGVTISMMINILINNLMRVWVRFKNNFYGDESYLTHTLPVEKTTLYFAKTLTAIISLFTSVLIIGLSILIAYYSKENFEFLKNSLNFVASIYDSTVFIFILLFMLMFFLQFLNILQAGYTGIIIGHSMHSLKTGMSVLFGFIIYMATQIFAIIMLFLISLFSDDLKSVFITNQVVSMNILKQIFCIAVCIYTLLIVGVYFINVRLFKKGVNVD